MRNYLIKTVSFLMAAVLFCSVCTLYASAAEKAYNIYSDPDISKTSGKFSTYLIDFRSDMTADGTYWALANFGLYKSRESAKKYRNISGGGAYAGLQDGAYAKRWNPVTKQSEYIRNPDGSYWMGKVGILSFWEMTYREKSDTVIMTATRVYPNGESTFGGEGEGTNCIQPYEWRDNSWYRMALHTWDDKETGTTFVGEWYLDIETGEWTLFSYFDTHLIGSCMQGGMGLFMENFASYTKEEVRTFNTKNLYAQDFEDGEWKSLPTCKISYGDGGAADKVGGHDFGATEEYFWGMAGGVVEDQAAYNKASTKQKTFTINQPESPDLGAPALDNIDVQYGEKGVNVSWTAAKTSTPQLSYKLEVVDKDGNTVAEKSETRPEITSCTFDGLKESGYTYKLTVTDIFGAQTDISFVEQEPVDPISELMNALPFNAPAFIAVAVIAASML